jgi:hypothetical protein
MSSIFSFLVDQVENSMGGWMKQTQVVTDQISNPLNQIINTVSGGIWKGQGAERFVEEMKSQILPMLGSLFTINMNFVGAIKLSHERVNQGQEAAAKLASGMMDEINSIF